MLYKRQLAKSFLGTSDYYMSCRDGIQFFFGMGGGHSRTIKWCGTVDGALPLISQRVSFFDRLKVFLGIAINNINSTYCASSYDLWKSVCLRKKLRWTKVSYSHHCFNGPYIAFRYVMVSFVSAPSFWESNKKRLSNLEIPLFLLWKPSDHKPLL